MEQSINLHKETATQFMRLIASGEIDKAYDQFMVTKGIHHNQFVMAGFPALRAAMKKDYQGSPVKLLTIKWVIEEGDMVVVHSHMSKKIDDPGWQLIHMFRFKDDLIVELWDCSQALSANSPNADGAF